MTDALTIDVKRHEVMVKGKEVALTKKEFEILKLLKDANGEVLSRQAIIKGIYGTTRPRVAIRTIDQHLARLRRKIKAPVTRTVRGYGYKFVGQ